MSGIYKWSRTANSNQSADPLINYAEGQSPGSLNDAGRGVMAGIAAYRDDIAGAIVTGGSVNSYTVTSFSGYGSGADMNGQKIAFTPHVTNTGACQINVDALGLAALRPSPGVDFLGGELIAGTPYMARFNSTDGSWYLFGYYGSSNNVPLGGMLDYIGLTAPNSAYALPFGQAVSRTTYANLFALVSTTYGGGDGSTTFNLPDLRGRVTAGKDDMGGSAANRLTSAGSSITGTTLGAVGGAEVETLGLGHLPTSITAGTAAVITVNFGGNVPRTAGSISGSDYNNGGGPLGGNFPASTSGGVGDWNGIGSASTSGTVSVTSNNTGSNAPGGAKNVVTAQPTIVVSKILRVI